MKNLTRIVLEERITQHKNTWSILKQTDIPSIPPPPWCVDNTQSVIWFQWKSPIIVVGTVKVLITAPPWFKRHLEVNGSCFILIIAPMYSLYMEQHVLNKWCKQLPWIILILAITFFHPNAHVCKLHTVKVLITVPKNILRHGLALELECKNTCTFSLFMVMHSLSVVK